METLGSLIKLTTSLATGKNSCVIVKSEKLTSCSRTETTTSISGSEITSSDWICKFIKGKPSLQPITAGKSSVGKKKTGTFTHNV